MVLGRDRATRRRRRRRRRRCRMLLLDLQGDFTDTMK